MDIYVEKKGYYLVPADQDSLKAVKGMTKDVHKIKIVKARNYELHKKFFSLLNFGHEHTKLDLPFDVFRKVMIMRAGYFKAYNTGKGIHYEAESISFANMSEDVFQEVYKRVLQKIAEDIETTNEDLLNELINY